MAEWVTHLMVADLVLEELPSLCRHEFCVGNIAPDCNVENEDWTQFTPPREMTHWMGSERKNAADCERFLMEYLFPRRNRSRQQVDFLWGYYAHLVTDAEFQYTIRDEQRVKAAWERIKAHPELGVRAAGMPPTWDSIKQLIDRSQRYCEIATLERDYLDATPTSGYLTEIMGLTTFPDYLDFLPQGAIARKVAVMGILPERKLTPYAGIAMSKKEYFDFVHRAAALVTEGIRRLDDRKSYIQEKLL